MTVEDDRIAPSRAVPERAEDAVVVRELSALPDGFAALVRASEAEGYRFLTRMLVAWEDGSNRFSADGEALLGAFAGDEPTGVCGLNVDPYAADAGVGRLRHLYVPAPWRRRGVGARLVTRCLARAEGRFDAVRLRVPDAAAARFYEALGFRTIDAADATHARSSSGREGRDVSARPARSSSRVTPIESVTPRRRG